MDGAPLRRSLGVWHLTMISVGATLGTGILVVLGTAVPLAGPAVWISFVLAGVAALLSALSYAEMAGAVPTSGLELLLHLARPWARASRGSAGGASSSSTPSRSPRAPPPARASASTRPSASSGCILPTALAAPPGGSARVVNLPAAVLVLLATAVLLPGARESAWVNTLMVVVKIALLVFFVVVAFTAFGRRTSNRSRRWVPPG